MKTFNYVTVLSATQLPYCIGFYQTANSLTVQQEYALDITQLNNEHKAKLSLAVTG